MHFFKPGVSRRVHLFAAPAFWTLVACLLIYKGWRWLGTASPLFPVLIALLLGTLKSVLLLDRIARRSLNRILRFGDNTCLGAVYSWKSWLLVVGMVTLGILMRQWCTPGVVLATLYMGIGWSLLFSSRLGWFYFLHED
ncbi:MAG: hypothetical protein ACOX4Z_10425 [Desulfobulbus sp.]|jgi:hypothetical protein|nr:hypothetical protein [Desulfobulbaceae bacterium]